MSRRVRNGDPRRSAKNLNKTGSRATQSGSVARLEAAAIWCIFPGGGEPRTPDDAIRRSFSHPLLPCSQCGSTPWHPYRARLRDGEEAAPECSRALLSQTRYPTIPYCPRLAAVNCSGCGHSKNSRPGLFEGASPGNVIGGPRRNRIAANKASKFRDSTVGR
jgi:hypothetical protein